MKFKLCTVLLGLSLLLISCGSDPECTIDSTLSIEQNIIGTWTIDDESTESVTFISGGTGTSTGDFHFAVENEGNTYNKFNWMMEGDSVIVVTYDYSPDTPVIPFIVSEDYTVLAVNCDKIEMESGFGSSLDLSK